MSGVLSPNPAVLSKAGSICLPTSDCEAKSQYSSALADTRRCNG
jgi:hypothetical protein